MGLTLRIPRDGVRHLHPCCPELIRLDVLDDMDCGVRRTSKVVSETVRCDSCFGDAIFSQRERATAIRLRDEAVRAVHEPSERAPDEGLIYRIRTAASGREEATYVGKTQAHRKLADRFKEHLDKCLFAANRVDGANPYVWDDFKGGRVPYIELVRLVPSSESLAEAETDAFVLHLADGWRMTNTVSPEVRRRASTLAHDSRGSWRAGATCPRLAAYSRGMSRLPLSEGLFVYLLGLAVIATRPGRFWLGFALVHRAHRSRPAPQDVRLGPLPPTRWIKIHPASA